MEFFTKVVKNYNYFSIIYNKDYNHRFLTEFWIRLSLNKYSLTCKNDLELCIVWDIFRTCLLLQIQTYSGIFTSYLDIFCHILEYSEPCVTLSEWEPSHIQNPGTCRTQGLLRTLSRHILTFSERCVRLTYWEPYHIQNIVIFRILAYLGLQAYSIYSAYSEPCLFRHI